MLKNGPKDPTNRLNSVIRPRRIVLHLKTPHARSASLRNTVDNGSRFQPTSPIGFRIGFLGGTSLVPRKNTAEVKASKEARLRVNPTEAKAVGSPMVARVAENPTEVKAAEAKVVVNRTVLTKNATIYSMVDAS